MDKEKISIFVILFFAFLIPLSAIYYVEESSKLEIQSNSTKEVDTSSKKIKVAILGSSRVMPLDAEYIDEYILKNGKEFDVYNHALTADNPSRRLAALEKTISEKPDIVFIGLDIGHYLETIESQTSISNFQSKFHGCSTKLPEIQDLYYMMPINREILGLSLDNLGNPKLSTLTLIYEFSNPSKLNDSVGDNTLEKSEGPSQRSKFEEENLPDNWKNALPSLTDKQSRNFELKRFHMLVDDETINKKLQEISALKRYARTFNPDGGEAMALREIIQRLQGEDIRVAIFSTPLYKQLFQVASTSCGINDFEGFMEDLSNEYGINHYYLHERFLDDDVWRDHSHVVHGENGIEYSTEIANALMNEV